MCSFKEKKSDPSEFMQLDGYTVDYIEPASGEFIVVVYFARNGLMNDAFSSLRPPSITSCNFQTVIAMNVKFVRVVQLGAKNNLNNVSKPSPQTLREKSTRNTLAK